MNARLATDLVKTLLLAPLRKLVPRGVREAVVQTAAKVLGVAHKTNPSGNNMSQR
ncbi:MAG: hypothetical protein Q8P18_32330 [Pseudomonadota bacterium]|nr:hypothetical protein [Pseudomonadota bacterium]